MLYVYYIVKAFRGDNQLYLNIFKYRGRAKEAHKKMARIFDTASFEEVEMSDTNYDDFKKNVSHGIMNLKNRG